MKLNWRLAQRQQHKIRGQEARIAFSFKREVFFIVVGGFVGALVMAIPMTFFSPGRSYGYDITSCNTPVFGDLVPLLYTIIAGVTFLLEGLTATTLLRVIHQYSEI